MMESNTPAEQQEQRMDSAPASPRPDLSQQTTPALPSDAECLIGGSAHVAEMKQFLCTQATNCGPVLLLGERGLRQKQAARLRHRSSAERALPFVCFDPHPLSADATHALVFGPSGLLNTVRAGTILINDLTGLPPITQQQLAVYLAEQKWINVQSWQPRERTRPRQRLVFATE